MDALLYWGFITTGLFVAGVVMWLAWAFRNDRAKSGAITIRMNGDYDFVIENGTCTRRLISMVSEHNAFGLDILTLTFTDTDDKWKSRLLTP